MSKPQLVNIYDRQAIVKVEPRANGFNLMTGFDVLANSYYAQGHQNGATEQEVKEGMVDSILTTECPLSVEEMTQHIQRGWPEYKQPSEQQMQENQKLHEAAVRVRVETNYQGWKEHLGKKADRATFELYRLLMPEYELDIVNKAYETRDKTDEFAEIYQNAYKKFFTKENMDFYTKPRTDAELVEDWPRLNQMTLFINESQNLLMDIRKDAISESERAKMYAECGKYMEFGQHYPGRMALMVSPTYVLTDNEQLRNAPLDAQKALGDVFMNLPEEFEEVGREPEAWATAYMRGAFMSAGRLKIDALQNALANNVVPAAKVMKLGTVGAVKNLLDEFYDMVDEDGHVLPDLHEASKYALENGGLFFLRNKDLGELLPAVVTDKERGTFAFQTAVPEEIIRERAQRTPVKPEEPGFFSRLLSNIKELFTGTPTATVRKYEEDLAKYEFEIDKQETFQYVQSLQEEEKARPAREQAKAAAKAAEKAKRVERVNALDPTMKTEMQAACETLTNSKEGPDAITAVGTLMTCASLMEAKQSVSPAEFNEIRSELMKTGEFAEMTAKMDKMSNIVKNMYQKDDLSSCLKVTDRLLVAMNNIKAQPQKTAPAPQLQKTASKGGPEL